MQNDYNWIIFSLVQRINVFQVEIEYTRYVA